MTLEHAVTRWVVVGIAYILTCIIFWWCEVKP